MTWAVTSCRITAVLGAIVSLSATDCLGVLGLDKFAGLYLRTTI